MREEIIEIGKNMKEEIIKIKIGNLKYSISFNKDSAMEMNNLLGFIAYNKGEIVLVKGMSEDKKIEVLMHELTHAVLDDRNIQNSCVDENFVDSFAKGLISLIQNNHELIEVVQKIKNKENKLQKFLAEENI